MPEVIGVAKGGGEHGALSSSNLKATSDKKDESKVYSLFHFRFYSMFA